MTALARVTGSQLISCLVVTINFLQNFNNVWPLPSPLFMEVIHFPQSFSNGDGALRAQGSLGGRKRHSNAVSGLEKRKTFEKVDATA